MSDAFADIPAHGSLLTMTFRIGAHQYGLPVSDVLDVIQAPGHLTLTETPPVLCSKLSFRGCPLSVLDGRLLVGETPAHGWTMKLIVAGSNRQQQCTSLVGLLVDQVYTVRLIPLKHFSADHRFAAPAFLSGAFDLMDELILLFDTRTLLSLALRLQ